MAGPTEGTTGQGIASGPGIAGQPLRRGEPGVYAHPDGGLTRLEDRPRHDEPTVAAAGVGDVPAELHRAELQDRYTSACKEVAELTDVRRNEGGPEGQPDLELQLQLCAGALHSVEQVAARLVAQLAPVMRRPYVELGGKAERTPDAMRPRTKLGQQAAELYSRLSLVEELLARAAGEVEL